MPAWMMVMYSLVFIALVALIGQVKSDCSTAETCLSTYSVYVQNYDWETPSNRNDTCWDLDRDLEVMKTCVDTELASCNDQQKVTTTRNMKDQYIQNIDFYAYHCTPGCEEMQTTEQVLANCSLPLKPFETHTSADATPYCRAVQGVLDCQVAAAKGCSILEDVYLNITAAKQAYGHLNGPQSNCGITLDGQVIPAKASSGDGGGDVCTVVGTQMMTCVQNSWPGSNSGSMNEVGQAVQKLSQSDDNTAECNKFKDVDYPKVNMCFTATNVSACLMASGAPPSGSGSMDRTIVEINPFVHIKEICTTDCSKLMTRLGNKMACMQTFPELESLDNRTSLNSTECGHLGQMITCVNVEAGTCAFIQNQLRSDLMGAPNFLTILGSCNITIPDYLTTTTTAAPTTTPVGGSGTLKGGLIGSVVLAWVILQNIY